MKNSKVPLPSSMDKDSKVSESLVILNVLFNFSVMSYFKFFLCSNSHFLNSCSTKITKLLTISSSYSKIGVSYTTYVFYLEHRHFSLFSESKIAKLALIVNISATLKSPISMMEPLGIDSLNFKRSP